MRRSGSELNPGIIGANVSSARRRLGLNQAELAEKIGVSRPTLVAIESGQRAPSADAFSALARVLGMQIRDLASLPAPDESAIVRFRSSLKNDGDATAAVDALVDFGRYYKLLENELERNIAQNPVDPIPFDHLNVDSINFFADDLASSERAKFNLGDGPIRDLRSVLEQDAGMIIFGLRELSQTAIIGLFVYALDVPLIAFNPAQRDSRRQNWTLAHEYAHYLTNRYDAEITYESQGKRGRDRREVFAEAFAARFLMPATGVSRRFFKLIGNAESATVSHIVLLANQFHVSFQAMCRRLEEMERIPRHTYEHVMSKGFKPIEAERAIGIERRSEWLEPYPVRYTFMISTLLRQGILSEGDAARYLRTDRLTARDILHTFDADPQFSLDAPLERER